MFIEHGPLVKVLFECVVWTLDSSGWGRLAFPRVLSWRADRASIPVAHTVERFYGTNMRNADSLMFHILYKDSLRANQGGICKIMRLKTQICLNLNFHKNLPTPDSNLVMKI